VIVFHVNHEPINGEVKKNKDQGKIYS